MNRILCVFHNFSSFMFESSNYIAEFSIDIFCKRVYHDYNLGLYATRKEKSL